MTGLPNDVNGCVQNFARIYNSMPVLEDGLSSGHASDTENNNPNSISMQKDHHREIVDVNEKYIDSSLDNPQTTLISAIQTSVVNNQQKPPPRNSVALGYGISVDNDEMITSNNVALMKNNKETSLINNAINVSSVASTSPSLIPSMTGMANTTASHINTPAPMNIGPNGTSASSSTVNQLLNNQKRSQQPNSNNLTNFLTSSQLPQLMSSPNSHERELKDVTNHIIQNNITNSSRQQASSMGMNKKGDIDLDSLYSTLSK